MSKKRGIFKKPISGISADGFLKYIRNIYIGGCTKEALFPISLWNKSDEIFSDVAQVTNNSCEQLNVIYNKAINSKSFTTAVQNIHKITCFQEAKLTSMEKKPYNIRKCSNYIIVQEALKKFKRLNPENF